MKLQSLVHDGLRWLMLVNILSINEVPSVFFLQFSRDELGMMNPVWIRDQEVDHCAVCASQFSMFTLRRHHCRACGCVSLQYILLK